MNLQIKLLVKQLNIKFDVLWCFDFNLYTNLKIFNSKLNIYHPVDIIDNDLQIKPAKTADLIMSVSEKLLNPFNKFKNNILVVNHGLSEIFVKIATNKPKLITNSKTEGVIKAGYVGNLLNYTLDRNHILTIIENNPQVKFYFWGAYNLENNNLSLDFSISDEEFIQIMKKSNNVILNGAATPEKIANEIEPMDIFFISYKYPNGSYDRYNSHKILEYLSTGKVVVSSYLSYYEDKMDLIQMVISEDNESFPNLFNETINHLDFYNNIEKQLNRKLFAIENSYINQIKKIENFINEKFNQNKFNFK